MLDMCKYNMASQHDSKSKEFIINTPFVTSWRVVSPRLARCHLGSSDKIVELNQGVCKGKEIAYFVKIYR